MTKTNNHVLFLPRWYPSDTDPMLGLFIKNHSIAAISAGYRVTVAYPSASDKKFNNRLQIHTINEGNLTEIIAYYSASHPFRTILQFFAWYKTIKLAFRLNGPPSLIHAHILTRTGIIALIVSLLYNVPYIVTEHWSRYFPQNPGYRGLVRKLLTKLVIKHASCVTVVSARLFKAMHSHGLDFPFIKLPNVIDIQRFDISHEHSLCFQFVNISCFEEKSKNLKMLIDAAKMHRTNGYEFELVLVGDGSDRKQIEAYCDKVKFDAIFKGTLEPAQTAELLKRSHCLVLSSNYETFGIVAYEALSCGVPVITTNVADLEELIDKNSGIVIPVGDTVSLASAMKSVQENYNRYDPVVLRNKVSNICSTESVSNIIKHIYQPLIKIQ